MRIFRRSSFVILVAGWLGLFLLVACGDSPPPATVVPPTHTAGTATPMAAQEMIKVARSEIQAAVTLYRNGQTDAAYEAAANVYLIRFESLEGDLNKADKTTVPAIEADFKALRDDIKAGKPPADIDLIATRLDASLNQAASLLAR